jgi:hypothetical protein
MGYPTITLRLFKAQNRSLTPLINLIQKRSQNLRLEPPRLINLCNLLLQFTHNLFFVGIILLIEFEFVVYFLDACFGLCILAPVVVLNPWLAS